MIKYIMMYFILLGSISSIFAQETINSDWQAENKTQYSKEVFEFYGSEYLTKNLSKTKADILRYREVFATQGYYIEDSPKDISSLSDLLAVRRVASKNNTELSKNTDTSGAGFNILTYDIQATEQKQYFRIGNTGKILVVLPRKELIKIINTK